MATEEGSTVPRRKLGRELRNLRENSQLSAEAAAKMAEMSRPRLWRIEGGKVPTPGRDVRELCRIYGASPKLTEALVGLAGETKNQNWYHAYGDVIPDWFEMYLGIEGLASTLQAYAAELIPGLLQTREYAEAVFRTHLEQTETELSGRLDIRMERQAVLNREQPPQFEALISETAIRRVVGSPAIMAAQLEHVLGLFDRPNISIRILPFTAGAHPAAMVGSMVILRFTDVDEPDTVYVEGLTGALYLIKEKEVSRYDLAFRATLERSLDESASKTLIRHAAKEFTPQ